MVQVRLPGWGGEDCKHGEPMCYEVWLNQEKGAALIEGWGEEGAQIDRLCPFSMEDSEALANCADALVELGAHPSSTIEFRLFWYHVDYILASPQLQTIGWHSGQRRN